jgi:hypothetical protein
MWKLKKDAEVTEPAKTYTKTPREEELEMEISRMKNKINSEKIPEKVQEKKEEESISKQEVIDMIEGNINRVIQLVELLRRV